MQNHLPRITKSTYSALDLSIAEVTLLEVRFHRLIKDQLIRFLTTAAIKQQKTVVGHVNIHAMNLAYELPWYKKFLNEAQLVYCDGIGVIVAARLLGHSVTLKHRQTCPDWIEALALSCQDHQLSLFLLASEPHVLTKAVDKLHSKTPRLRLAGHHGYFCKTGPENESIINRINAFNPDILCVGFGMPLQEQWIKDNKDRLKAQVFLPMGGCLDYYTNRVYRGPRWLTDHGLEWVIRTATQPKRLWRRYLVGNPLFFWRLAKHLYS
ncbi:MAG: WecB/TagA/CpsF family glycosyltransferase [Anaerolineae bacterium]|nr:WecB/TagA/CpsF family glycosyltransferase [Anaerolineae bacterium]